MSSASSSLHSSNIARRYLDRLLDDLRRRACTPIEVDGEELTMGVPDDWSDAVERGTPDYDTRGGLR